jgi:putative SOS response-associated peptidase YedK
MCGRYAVTLPPEMMRDLFAHLNRIDFPPRYNIAPTQPIVAIWHTMAGREARLVRWGFVPNWIKDPRPFPLVINARVEGITEKPTFRDAMKHQRCIIPANGYYEWRAGPGKSRIPYYVTLKDKQPFAFAGLYSTWEGPDGEEVDTAAIVTVPAKNELAEIHDREPAILLGDSVEQWLDVRSVRAAAAEQLALPLPPGMARFHPVSSLVNSNQNDGPELIAYADPDVTGRPSRRASPAQLDLF